MIWDVLMTIALVLGAIFALVGAIGLVKLDTPMKRLHAPTKASTMGVGSLLLASIIQAFALGDGSLREVLIMAFLFVTAPISAHLISKVNMHRENTREAPPPPPGSGTWAVYDTNEADVGDPGQHG
ncbi:multisubunit potassium/proton antiporter, PhaG subunit (TC 2.A.63.1.1) [Palleronia marisminoris]|uniref:Na(+)/H(+) antiporter subunit G n=1 Tax=Palleronia marisminoris TaxID=315423 RepID=A0A1Y5T1Q5_9RHOB|nr:Na+/H+ antiporter subunit G [Palleronia marisminoris]SFH08012.1 multisubunit potassium/proton antiporter, PhaG subunit (TC 2.A.63.1.1) [Palleronia marisminoris]SLN52063.1 Na(+)/H(+) antiporter subunit G [Palleronia marisminoris]